ncbi:MAG: uracil-DNA glycosylase [Desulfobacteraceae bacterium]|nr:uracil-DNA glycosylase [Desulfobacteraceae bacterium]
MNEKNNIRCHHCQHFFITWEVDHPYGCHAMNFKSKQIPSAVVFKSSGEKCMLFKAKTKNTSEES